MNTRKLLQSITTLTAIVLVSFAGSRSQQLPAEVGKLPLGSGDLPESRTANEVGPGLVYTHIRRGYLSPDDTWMLRVNLPIGDIGTSTDPDAPTGMLGSQRNAETVARRLTELGWKPRVQTFVTPPLPHDVRSHVLGYTVSVGSSTSEAGLAPDESRLHSQGFQVRRWHMSYDGDDTTGPWEVHVLSVDPHLWDIVSSHGESITGRETVSAIASHFGAVAAVNGGFFVLRPYDPKTGTGDGIAGESAGISVVNGKLVSEATNGRPALILANAGRDARIARLTTRVSVTGAGGRHFVDGLNRVPGVIRNCGGVGGDAPTERPVHDFTCADRSEIVVITPDSLASLPAGPGVEAVLDGDSRVIEVRPRNGTPVPEGHWVLQAIGEEAAWLRRNSRVGAKLSVEAEVRDSSGAIIRLSPGDYIVNGGPLLVRSGELEINADGDGLVRHDSDVDNFYFSWVRQRNPRTMVGIDGRGNMLLVVADGRQAGSAGLSILEASRVMRALGSVTAMNLDGGGSTTMFLRGQVVNKPSDSTGERANADAILSPKRNR